MEPVVSRISLQSVHLRRSAYPSVVQEGFFEEIFLVFSWLQPSSVKEDSPLEGDCRGEEGKGELSVDLVSLQAQSPARRISERKRESVLFKNMIFLRKQTIVAF